MEQPDTNQPDRILDRVYTYDDYRTFLRDFFSEQKQQKHFFSHRYFARKAGLSSPSMVLDIIKGSYNLTMKTLPRIIKGMGLKGRAAEYFENLVWHNQSKESAEQDKYYKNLQRLRKTTRLYRLNRNHYQYFGRYYYAVIREVAAFATWNGDFHILGSLLVPPISATEAQKAVELLQALGLLVKNENGGYEQRSPGLTTADIPAAVHKEARREFLRLGIRAADTISPSERYCAHTTLSISRENYEEAVRILDDARAKIVKLALDSELIDRVYEVVLQAFPVSRMLGSHHE